MVSNINDAFMKFERRAEGVEIQKLVETFVDIGPLFTLLGITDHQVIHGRRGTGKTHALTYLAESKKGGDNITIYCDLRSVGSNTSIYGDPTRELSEGATRLLIDVVTVIHDALYEFCCANAERHDLSVTGPLLDKLCDSIGDVIVVGTTEVEQRDMSQERAGTEAGFSLSSTGAGLSASISGKETSSREGASE